MSKGIHILLDLANCNISKINDEEFVRQVLVMSASKAKMTFIDVQSNNNESSGVSCILMLENAHISFHSFSGTKTALVDILICNDINPINLVGYIVNEFESKQYNIKTLNRGDE